MIAADRYRKLYENEHIADDVLALRNTPNGVIREFLVKATRPVDSDTQHFLVNVGRIQAWRPPEQELICAQPYIVCRSRDQRIDAGFAADLRRRFAKEE
jgi:hypothetical protein